MIAILCPTYRRASLCKRMMDTNCSDVYLGTDAQDLFDLKCLGANPKDSIHCHPMLPTVQKWNNLAIQAMKNPDNKLFMLGSDDMYFATSGWDYAIKEHYNALENKIHVYHLQDSRDPDGTPHPIVTREYIEAMGYFLPPIFLHWFCDSWTVDIAKSNGVFTHLRDFSLVHDKPSDRGEGDETFSRIRSFGWRERDAYVADTCKNFLLAEKLKLCQYMPFNDINKKAIV